MDTSQTAVPVHCPIDTATRTRIAGYCLLADLLDIDRVEVEDHPVIDGDFGDVANNFGEMLGSDISADGIGVGIPRRAPCSVGG